MKNSKMLFVVAIMVICLQGATVVAMDCNNDIVDIRKFGLEFKHNQQDECKNTFWHRLVFESACFRYWSDAQEKIKIFKNDNNKWLPNPLIVNIDGRTAKEEAKIIFSASGNPVTKLLIDVLKQQESYYVEQISFKNSRATMIYAQQMGLENPKG